MGNAFLTRLLRLVIIIVVQVIILNNVHLFGYATPLLIGFFIQRFHYGSSRIGILIYGFIAGAIYDMFSDTMGMGMASMTLLAMLQPTLLQLFKPRDAADDFTPSFKSMGLWLLIPYTIISMLILHTSFFMLEAFSIANMQLTFTAIVAGTLLTSLLIVFIEVMLNSTRQD